MATNDTTHISSLRFLIGHWETSGEVVAAGGPAVKISGTDIYEWILDKNFILHKANVLMGDERVEVFEIIGPLNQQDREVQMRSFDNVGNFTLMQGKIGDDIFSITGNDMHAVLSVDGENKMSAHWEKQENNLWKPWMKLVFSKKLHDEAH